MTVSALLRVRSIVCRSVIGLRKIESRHYRVFTLTLNILKAVKDNIPAHILKSSGRTSNSGVNKRLLSNATTLALMFIRHCRVFWQCYSLKPRRSPICCRATSRTKNTAGFKHTLCRSLMKAILSKVLAVLARFVSTRMRCLNLRSVFGRQWTWVPLKVNPRNLLSLVLTTRLLAVLTVRLVDLNPPPAGVPETAPCGLALAIRQWLAFNR